MLGSELYLLPRKAKESPLFGIAWCYPNTYSVGMSGLGYQLVWWLMEKDPELAVRRVFTDMAEGQAEEELIGFTMSWELDFINVLSLLKKNGVPLVSCDRGDQDKLVFGGGPVLSANPEPFADFFDVILLGDAEAMVPAFLQQWKTARTLKSRKDRLLYLSQLPGIYVPQLYNFRYDDEGPIESIETVSNQVPKTVAKVLFKAPPEYAAHTVVLSNNTAWGDTFLIEMVRSCPQECRFCLASFLTRPFRAANVDTLMEKIELGLAHTRKIGLLGPSVTEHPEFERLAERLLERGGIQISVASIRADTVSEPILKMIKNLGQRSVTIAIESGSERLRAIMKKNLTESEIENAVLLIDQAGLEGLKFYGIVGLPHETWEDLDETVRLMTKLQRAHKRLRFVFGVSSFVPKAQTPFQWHARDRQCKEKLEYVRKHLAKVGIDVRPESHNWSDIQALLSRGDRRLTKTLLAVAENGTNLGAWKKALKSTQSYQPGMDYYAFREIPASEILPWQHLTDLVKTDYLEKHRHQAADLATTAP